MGANATGSVGKARAGVTKTGNSYCSAAEGLTSGTFGNRYGAMARARNVAGDISRKTPNMIFLATPDSRGSVLRYECEQSGRTMSVASTQYPTSMTPIRECGEVLQNRASNLCDYLPFPVGEERSASRPLVGQDAFATTPRGAKDMKQIRYNFPLGEGQRDGGGTNAFQGGVQNTTSTMDNFICDGEMEVLGGAAQGGTITVKKSRKTQGQLDAAVTKRLGTDRATMKGGQQLGESVSTGVDAFVNCAGDIVPSVNALCMLATQAVEKLKETVESKSQCHSRGDSMAAASRSQYHPMVSTDANHRLVISCNATAAGDSSVSRIQEQLPGHLPSGSAVAFDHGSTAEMMDDSEADSLLAIRNGTEEDGAIDVDPDMDIIETEEVQEADEDISRVEADTDIGCSPCVFYQIECVVNVHDIDTPMRTARLLDAGHLKVLEGVVGRLGYVQSKGDLAVTLKDDVLDLNDVLVDVDPAEDKVFGGRRKLLKVRSWVIDGRHRMTVFTKRLSKDPSDPGFYYIGAVLWLKRKEPSPVRLSFLEMVCLAARLNEPNEAARGSSTSDQLHQVVMITGLLAESHGSNLSKATIARNLMTLKFSGSLSTALRFARIGFRLHADVPFASDVERLCHRFPRLKPAYLGTQRVLDMPNYAILLCFEAVGTWLSEWHGKGTQTSYVSEMINYFARCEVALRRMSEECGKTVPAILESPAALKAEKIKNREYVIRHLAKFRQGSGDESSLRRLGSKIRQSLNLDSEGAQESRSRGSSRGADVRLRKSKRKAVGVTLYDNSELRRPLKRTRVNESEIDAALFIPNVSKSVPERALGSVGDVVEVELASSEGGVGEPSGTAANDALDVVEGADVDMINTDADNGEQVITTARGDVPVLQGANLYVANAVTRDGGRGESSDNPGDMEVEAFPATDGCMDEEIIDGMAPGTVTGNDGRADGSECQGDDGGVMSGGNGGVQGAAEEGHDGSTGEGREEAHESHESSVQSGSQARSVDGDEPDSRRSPVVSPDNSPVSRAKVPVSQHQIEMAQKKNTRKSIVNRVAVDPNNVKRSGNSAQLSERAQGKSRSLDSGGNKRPAYDYDDDEVLLWEPSLLQRDKSLRPALDDEKVLGQWLTQVALRPSLWNTNAPSFIQSPCLLLQRLGFPEGHRAYDYASREVIHAQAVFIELHLSNQRYEHLQNSRPQSDSVVSEVRASRPSPQFVHDLGGGTATETKVDSLSQTGYLCDQQVGLLGAKLENDGFVVCSEIFADSNILLDRHPRKKAAVAWDFEKAFECAQESFTEDSFAEQPEGRLHWNLVPNRSVDEDKRDFENGKGRWMERRANIVRWDEGKCGEAAQRAARDRVIMEIRVMMLMHQLNLLGMWEDAEERLEVPVTGGRFFYSGVGCKRQLLHHDSEPRSSEQCVPAEYSVDGNPGYSAIVSGPDGAFMWVGVKSHYYFGQGSLRLGMEYLKNQKIRLVTIPPMSVIIMRADLLRAGHRVHRDSQGPGGITPLIRLHLPVRRRGQQNSVSQFLSDELNDVGERKMDRSYEQWGSTDNTEYELGFGSLE